MMIQTPFLSAHRRARPGRRRRALAAAVLYLLLLVLPVLHADASSHERGEMHLHAPADRDLSCVPTHDEVYCQACRALDARALGVPGDVTATPMGVERAAAMSPPDAASLPLFSWALHARAPPAR
ncbi:MAG: hypothetical protein H0U67_07935 [Gemmatimonadetes bacterium]|nr:hypothetical protein [Gemmatimonadota bacterium]